MYYYIKSILESADGFDISDIRRNKGQFAAVLTSDEWAERRDTFDMGIEMDIDLSSVHSTKAEVNYDSLTGTFSVPDRKDPSAPDTRFAFALDEKGIVLIDDSGYADRIIEKIIRTKKSAKPGLERFIYDFLEQIISEDQVVLEKYDKELDRLESDILSGSEANPSKRLSKIRSDLRDMRIHYEQLIDLGQEFEENENNFFKKDNLRYFHLFTQRVERLHDIASSLRDYTMQIRELYQSQLEVKQNRIMTVLTVITSIFMPLTLIAGWYGMNFRYMPELEFRYAYPVVIILSVLIVLISLIFFKKKKWL